MTTTTAGSDPKQSASARRRDLRVHRRDRVCARRRPHSALAAAAALAVLAAGPASVAAVPQSHAAAVWVHRPGQFSAAQTRGARKAPSLPARTTVGSLTARALFAKVHRAYLHVPAVELTVVPGKSTLRFPRRFVLVLRSGVVVAEEFTRSGRDETSLVARRRQPTYSRPAGAKCWRRLPSSNPQTLTDIGIPFPYTRSSLGVGDKALPPEKTASGWIEATENRAEFWFLTLQPKRPAHLLDESHLPIKRFITYVINGKSHLLETIFIQQPDHRRKQKNWLHATFRVSSLTSTPQLPAPAPAC